MKAYYFFGFVSFLLSMNSFAQVKDTSQIQRPIQEIEEVFVSSNFKQIVFEDTRYYIIDFNVSELGHYVLLKKLRNYQLYKLNDKMDVISKIRLDFKPTQLLKDCLGGLHILSEDSMYQLNPFADEISIYERNSIELYDSFYKNCVGQSGDHIFMEEINDFGQSKKFFAINRQESTVKLIYEIKDSVAAADANAEYLGILGNSHLEVQRMQEINVSQLGSSRRHFERVCYFLSVISKPDYNPLIVRNDTVHIFDHRNDLAIQFSGSGEALKTKTIDFHHPNNWTERNHLDEAKNTFYTEYTINKAQHFFEISPKNYKRGKETRITEHAHPEKFIVYNGYVYYTHKENFDANLNKLYRHKL